MNTRNAMLGWVVVIFFIGMSIGMTGCTQLKAKPSEGAGFVPVDKMSKRADLPFQKVWTKGEVDWNQYKTLYITDVHTEYLIEADWWQEGFRRDQIDQDAVKIAQYMRHKFIEAFRNDPNYRFEVLDSPRPGSLTIEMALTELVPSNVVLKALGFAPYGIGMGVTAVGKLTGASSTVAFEARIKDSNSGEILAMVADREEQKFNPIDVRGLTWYAPAEGIIDEWAEQFVKIANREPGEIVEDSKPFALKPW